MFEELVYWDTGLLGDICLLGYWFIRILGYLDIRVISFLAINFKDLARTRREIT